MKRTKIENKIYMLWSHVHELPRTGKDMSAFGEEGEKVAADVVVNKGVLGQEEAGKNCAEIWQGQGYTWWIC